MNDSLVSPFSLNLTELDSLHGSNIFIPLVLLKIFV